MMWERKTLRRGEALDLSQMNSGVNSYDVAIVGSRAE